MSKLFRISLLFVSGFRGIRFHGSVGGCSVLPCGGLDVWSEAGSCLEGWVVVVVPGIGCMVGVCHFHGCLSVGQGEPETPENSYCSVRQSGPGLQ